VDGTMLFHCWSKAKWSHKCRSLKQRWMELCEVSVLLVFYLCWFRFIFWILFYYWKKLGGVGVEHWNKGEWIYVRFLCFLFCFHVFFHFVLVLLLLKIVGWNKCRRLEEVRWNYVKFMCFLFCFHVVFHFFHFDTIILMLNQARWHKCI
jgi:hypothetical protein